jgi:regulator of PEP synthase PpsR (kinase-PPPase family)
MVANVSMVDGIEPPDELYAPELKDRVVGLVCDEVILSEYRKNRAMRVRGMSSNTKYDTPAQVERELNWSKFERVAFIRLTRRTSLSKRLQRKY